MNCNVICVTIETSNTFAWVRIIVSTKLITVVRVKQKWGTKKHQNDDSFFFVVMQLSKTFYTSSNFSWDREEIDQMSLREVFMAKRLLRENTLSLP